MAKKTKDVNISPPSDWQKIWEEYKLTESLELRNGLVEHYLPLVKHTAGRIKARLPNKVELDDLISTGVFGLMDAISAFDLSRGVEFETYCVRRIRGAILDELRAMDWVPRLVRSRANRYQQAVEVLGHAPTTKEISDHFGILLEDAERIKSAGNTPIVRFCRMIPGGKDQQEDNNHSGIMDSNAIADPNSLCPEDELSKDVGFQELISCLSNVERIVVTLYHRDEYEMRKIGKILGMSESRVSQIRSTALQRIKDSLVL